MAIAGTLSMEDIRRVLSGDLKDGFGGVLIGAPGNSIFWVERHPLNRRGIIVRVHSVGEDPIESFELFPPGRESDALCVILSHAEFVGLKRRGIMELDILIEPK